MALRGCELMDAVAYGFLANESACARRSGEGSRLPRWRHCEILRSHPTWSCRGSFAVLRPSHPTTRPGAAAAQDDSVFRLRQLVLCRRTEGPVVGGAAGIQPELIEQRRPESILRMHRLPGDRRVLRRRGGSGPRYEALFPRRRRRTE